MRKLLALLLLCSTAWAADDRSSLEAAVQAWTAAFNARDVQALLAHSTPDVLLMDPELASPVTREEVARRLSVSRGQLVNATKEIVISGDVAWRIGVLARTQSLEVWKRIDGEWKLHRQSASGVVTTPRIIRRPSPREPVFDTPTN